MTLPLAEQSPEAPTSAAEVWGAVQDLIKPALSDGSYRMWFAGVEAHSVDEAGLQLDAPSDYVKNWLVAHYLELLTDSTRSVLGPQAVVRIDVAPDAGDPEATATEAAAGAPRRRRGRRTTHEPDPAQATLDEALDPATAFPDRYTFDAFVPGSSNKFAHAAAMAVAEAPPSRVYNPLFVYGGVGLGKTHLLFAIGQHMTRLNPRVRVRYVTSESFMTEFIRAVRDRRGYLFQRQYRDIDVLLLDDVQFLARAEETQTEFFHTFNHLHTAGRQIVIASDRPPHEISGMEERLTSRFRWGLCVDVQPPDLETRIAILQLKAERETIAVPSGVVEFVASKFDQSVRELEGALVRVVAWSELTAQPIDVELAERALQDLIPQTEHEIPPPLILEETARYFSLSIGDLVSKSRSRPLTQARHIAMYLVRECTGLSLVKIGEIFGGRDHTTVLHGINKVEGEMRARDTAFRQVQDLTRIIRGRVRGAA
jgi:chromosomal replication initiator protein